jgi:hypothetical protein
MQRTVLTDLTINRQDLAHDIEKRAVDTEENVGSTKTIAVKADRGLE